MTNQATIAASQTAATAPPNQTATAPPGIAKPFSARLFNGISRRIAPWSQRTSIRLSLRAAGLRNVESIRTYTRPSELAALFTLARDCPRGAKALEIGSYLGASTCYIAAGLAYVGGTLACVDTWENHAMSEGPRDTFAEFVRNVSPVRDRLVLHRTSTTKLDPQTLNGPFQLIFLDGDHSYEAVRSDFDLATRCLAPNGIIAMHDIIYFPGVARTVGEALISGQWLPVGQVENLLWITRLRK